MAMLVRYTMGGFASAIVNRLQERRCFYKHVSATKLIDQIAEIAETMRRQGPIALEQVRDRGLRSSSAASA